jgi:hypothetical protein
MHPRHRAHPPWVWLLLTAASEVALQLRLSLVQPPVDTSTSHDRPFWLQHRNRMSHERHNRLNGGTCLDVCE